MVTDKTNIELASLRTLDGKASIEHQLFIHLNDLFDASYFSRVSQTHTTQNNTTTHTQNNTTTFHTQNTHTQNTSTHNNNHNTNQNWNIDTQNIPQIEEVLNGIKYVADYRLRNNRYPNLDPQLMKKLLDALLLHMKHKNPTLLTSQKMSNTSNLAFQLFSQFLHSSNTFRLEVSQIPSHQLLTSFKIHRRIKDKDLEVRELCIEVLYWMMIYFSRQFSVRELVRESVVERVEELLSEYEIEQKSKPDQLLSTSLVNKQEFIYPPQSLYFDKSPKRLLDMFQTSITNGLSSNHIPELQQYYGPNNIPKSKPTSPLHILLNQILDFMVLVLIAGCIISAATGDLKSCLVLLVVVVLNIGIGFGQEYKASLALESLNHLKIETCTVLRNGVQEMINSVELVPGDIVLLSEGEPLPADIRLLECNQLEIIETLLTGESVPIPKNTQIIKSKSRRIPISECLNIGFMSTIVSRGSGKGMVVRIGGRTEIGRVSEALDGTTTVMTPLQKSLRILSLQLLLISLLLSVLIFLLGYFKNHLPLLNIFQITLSLVVSVIPEGLVAVVTLTMALGLNRLAKRQVLVKRLVVVEGLGGVGVICSDKTGTLTVGEMRCMKGWVCLTQSEGSLTEGGSSGDRGGDLMFEGGMSGAVKRVGSSSSGSTGSGSARISFALEYLSSTKGGMSTSDYSLFMTFMVCAICHNAALSPNTNTSTQNTKIPHTTPNNNSSTNGEMKKIGDPTEIALLIAALKVGLDKHQLLKDCQMQKIAELAFDSDRKMMSVCYSVGLENINNAYHTPLQTLKDLFLSNSETEPHPELPSLNPTNTTNTTNTTSNTILVLSKGAPESILNICQYTLTLSCDANDNGQKVIMREITDRDLEIYSQKALFLAAQGLRVLAFAFKFTTLNTTTPNTTTTPPNTTPITTTTTPNNNLTSSEIESSLCFLGLLGLQDPPRKNVKESIRKCKRAGIDVIMITGDHLVTACAIARQLGILPSSTATTEGEGESDSESVEGEGEVGEVSINMTTGTTGSMTGSMTENSTNIQGAAGEALKGAELDLLTVDSLASLSPFPKVFARVSPENKLQIIQALQLQSKSVAMIGDGVNDAAAIKQANIGIAMGTSTQITKDSSDLILLDDEFDGIVYGVEEGRRVFCNIRKFCVYLLSCNFGELLIMVFAIGSGLESPFTPMMILFANIVADVPPSLSLGMEFGERGMMSTGVMGSRVLGVREWGMIMVQSLCMSLTSFGVYLYQLHLDSVSSGSGSSSGSSASGGSTAGDRHAQTVTFAALTFTQLFQSFLSRSLTESIFQQNPLSNIYLLISVICCVLIMILAVLIESFARALELDILNRGSDWLMILICILIQVVVVELMKAGMRGKWFVFRKRERIGGRLQ